jgi:hypothetical protein
MAIVRTIAQIISVLIPIVWGTYLIVWYKTGKREEELSALSCILMFLGAIFCLSQVLNLIGLE